MCESAAGVFIREPMLNDPEVSPFCFAIISNDRETFENEFAYFINRRV